VVFLRKVLLLVLLTPLLLLLVLLFWITLLVLVVGRHPHHKIIIIIRRQIPTNRKLRKMKTRRTKMITTSPSLVVAQNTKETAYWYPSQKKTRKGTRETEGKRACRRQGMTWK